MLQLSLQSRLLFWFEPMAATAAQAQNSGTNNILHPSIIHNK